MGVEYSSGIFLPSARFLLGLDLTHVRARLTKLRVNAPTTLLSKQQLRALLDLSDVQAFTVLRLFDFNAAHAVSALDLLGAIGLAAADTIDDRLRFLFDLMDADGDNCLSEVDANILFYCVCRGFTRLKQLSVPPRELIAKVVAQAFHSELAVLTAQGHMSFAHLKPFVLVSEVPRMYLANLAGKTISRDVGRLLDDRVALLRDIAEMEASVQLLSDQLSDECTDALLFARERGGDSRLLQLSAEAEVEAPVEAQEADPSQPSEQQRLRRHARRKPPQQTQLAVEDARIFGSGCRLLDTGAGFSALDEAFAKQWALQRAREPLDGELLLDADLLQDLLEPVGVQLSDHDAALCLSEAPRNQLGMHLCADVLLWLHRFALRSRVARPAWLRSLAGVGERFSSAVGIARAVTCALQKQRALLPPPHPAREAYLRLLHLFRESGSLHVSALAGERVSETSSNVNFRLLVNGDEEEGVATGPAPASGRGSSGSGPPASAALGSRGRGAKPKPVAGKGGPSAALAAAPDDAAARDRHGANVRLLVASSFDFRAPSSAVADDSHRLLKPLAHLTAGDVLAHFEAKHAREARRERGGARLVFWLAITTGVDSSAAEADLLALAAANFFNAILHEHREGAYTSAEADVLRLHPEDGERAGQSDRVVLVALLNERDLWREFEAALPQDVLVSRAVRSADLSVCVRASLHELYAESLEYANYATRLYGPQEDELGEEGMNPLRFAKLRRQSKRAVEDRLERAAAAPLEAMRAELEEAGYSGRGTLAEVRERYRSVLSSQLERVGFGELSLFGKKVCMELFRTFSSVGDALSFHDMNRLLSSLHLPTIYDAQDFRALNKQHGFQVDSRGNLTQGGFIAYFEAVGHLSRSVETLRMGSCDDLVRGLVFGRVELQDGCISSLYSVCEQQTYAQMTIKKVLLLLSNIRDVNATLAFENVSDLLKPFVGDTEFLKSPGWLARAIHDLQEVLADGDKGVIPTMRRETLEVFKKYESFESSFDELCAPFSSGQYTSDSRHALLSKLESVLPPLVNSKGLREKLADLEKKVASLKACIPICEPELRDTFKQQISDCEAEAEDVTQMTSKAIQLLGCHSLAFYDALRMYGVGLGAIGGGNEDMCVQALAKGLDFVRYLPRGHGEPGAWKQKQADKVARAARRREEALAALERERMRRETSAEEIERLRKLKEDAVQRERDEDEKRLFDTAYLALTEHRESVVGSTRSECLRVVEMLRELAAIKDARYPYTLKAAIAHVNFAVVVLELEVENESEAQRDALAAVESALAEGMHDVARSYPVLAAVDETFFAEGFRSVDFPKHLPACYLLVLQNCLSILRRLQAFSTLSRSNAAVLTIGFLEEILSDKERANINAEREAMGMMILPYGDVSAELKETLDEFNQMRELELQRRAIEEQIRLDNERLAELRGHEDTADEVLRKLRLEKEETRRRRREDRINMIRTRNKLYGMIQSDEVSQLFRTKANATVEDFGYNGPKIKDPFESDVEDAES